MLDFNLTLQTNTILLRPLVLEDLKSFKALTTDKSMWIYFTSDLSNSPELQTWVETAVNEHQKKIRLPFTVIDKVSDQIVGATSFLNISFKDKRVEIGATWIAKDYQGKGVNDQIKFLMLEYCFDVLAFERVEFKTDVLNVPARKALLRIGASEEGILRSHTLMTNNRRRDTIYYSILKSEWVEVKKQKQKER